MQARRLQMKQRGFDFAEGADDLLGGGDQDESDPLLSELEADLLGGSDDEADEDIL